MAESPARRRPDGGEQGVDGVRVEELMDRLHGEPGRLWRVRAWMHAFSCRAELLLARRAMFAGLQLQCIGIRCWGIRNQAFRIPNHKTVSVVQVYAKGLAAKPQELSSPFSSFSTLRHLQSNQISPATQSVRVSVRLFVFLHDETPGVNLTRPASRSMGFARGFRGL
jgi:hypothetical protein